MLAGPVTAVDPHGLLVDHLLVPLHQRDVRADQHLPGCPTELRHVLRRGHTVCLLRCRSRRRRRRRRCRLLSRQTRALLLQGELRGVLLVVRVPVRVVLGAGAGGYHVAVDVVVVVVAV